MCPLLSEGDRIKGNCLTGWDTQGSRIFTGDSIAPAVCGADGGGGRNPAGLLFCASFSHKAGAKANGIGYERERSPTLTSNTPSVVVLNDQGGNVMDVSENITGTLRAQMHSHQPLVMATQQGGAEICEGLCPTITASAGLSGNNGPVLFEGHGKDARYTGPLEVAPTVAASYGTGGGNMPLVSSNDPETYAIAGNIIGRKSKNGGNGLGIGKGICPTVTSTDHHCVCLSNTYQDVIGALCRGDEKGIGNQYVSQDKCIVLHNLIRRLTPMECERLMNFPDGWTDISGASDSKRYKALGNSVVVSCMEYALRGIAYFLNQDGDL